jgi:uncharacterized protein
MIVITDERETDMIDALALLDKYYPSGSDAHRILLAHSRHVADKATAVARALTDHTVDVAFVTEAALLHDIGIRYTAVPALGCAGDLPYLCHGLKGRELLEAEGLPRHAMVCERHIGVGLTAEEIVRQNLPLPPRDMVPTTLEEQIVAYADLFFSKDPARDGKERSVAQVRDTLMRFGADKVAIFDQWHGLFAI